MFIYLKTERTFGFIQRHIFFAINYKPPFINCLFVFIKHLITKMLVKYIFTKIYYMKLFTFLSIIGSLLLVNVKAQNVDVVLFKKLTTLLSNQTTLIQKNNVTTTKIPEKVEKNIAILKDFYSVVDGTIGENITVKSVKSIGYWEVNENVLGYLYALTIADKKITNTIYTIRTFDVNSGKLIESFYPFVTLPSPTGLPKTAIKFVTATVVTPGYITLNQYFTIPGKKRHAEKTKNYKINSDGTITDN
jgi:hypothetical protein